MAEEHEQQRHAPPAVKVLHPAGIGSRHVTPLALMAGASDRRQARFPELKIGLRDSPNAAATKTRGTRRALPLDVETIS
jgi:hypothetical protein